MRRIDKRREKVEKTCLHCGGDFIGTSKFCSRSCQAFSQHGTKMNLLTCEICKKQFWRRSRGNDSLRCCSRECGFKLQTIEHSSTSLFAWKGWKRSISEGAFSAIVSWKTCDICGCDFFNSGLKKRCSDKCERHAQYRAMKYEPRKWNVSKCIHCGCEFRGSGKQCKDCADEAARLIKNARSRSRMELENADRTLRWRIFRRDELICWICGIKCDKPQKGWNPRQATLDHLTPLSRGGLHIEENLACCCHQCNSNKGSMTKEEVMTRSDTKIGRAGLLLIEPV